MRTALILLGILFLAFSSNTETIPQITEIMPDTGTNQFPLIFNNQVERWLKYYVTRGRNWFARKLQESGKYCEMIKRILKEFGLPENLMYVALVESGFNPFAYSRAGAVGIWQLTKHIRKITGLKHNYWIDERRDVEKSTYAAARELKTLYNQFGSWTLAIAAYNCGSNALKQAIKSQGTTDFWALALPIETMVFVPKVIAAIMIATDPESYGFSGEIKPADKFEVVNVTGCIDLNVIAKCCGTSLEEITILNPELTNQCTPDQPGEYALKIPEGTRNTFIQNFTKLSYKEK